jgi:hypothetical protein
MTLPVELSNIPWRSPWVPVASPAFEARLAREAGPAHVLYQRPTVSIGRRLDNDDVLFYLPAGPAMLAVVHLTYSERIPEPDPRFPYTVLYASLREWIDQCLVPDAHDPER